MGRSIRCRWAAAAVLAVLLGSGLAAAQGRGDFWKAEGRGAVVAAGGAEAADAAVDLLRQGGNAADAAVAAMLVLSVTDPGNFCFGGEAPVLVYDARRNVVEAVCGQGAAPRLATVEFFQTRKQGKIPGGGDPTTAAVPGAPAALVTLLDRYGVKTFAEAAAPMLALLDRPVQSKADDWRTRLAATVRRMAEAERASKDRRRGLRLAEDCFYRGPIARDLDAWSRAHGGLLRYTDLATHATRIEEPVSIVYRGRTVTKCGPWTQGPCLLQALRLLEGFDLAQAGRNSPQYVHLVTEAMKLALADRDTYYADPLYADVPLAALLSPQYADLRRPLIDLRRASLEQRPGDPLSGKALLNAAPAAYRLPAEDARDTTTCIVADAAGNVVCATPSGWGGVRAGDTGVLLGSRLRSFNAWPGHPNCIAPGKRPRITLTPTLLFQDDRPAAAISVAGGDLQDQVSLQLVLAAVDFGLPPAEAVTAPRFATDHLVGSFNQPPPQLGSLSAYDALGETVLAELKARGHQVKIARPPLGHPVMISLDPRTGLKRAAGDPKAGRHARAWAP